MSCNEETDDTNVNVNICEESKNESENKKCNNSEEIQNFNNNNNNNTNGYPTTRGGTTQDGRGKYDGDDSDDDLEAWSDND